VSVLQPLNSLQFSFQPFKAVCFAVLLKKF
jgi:hypothetical protein